MSSRKHIEFRTYGPDLDINPTEYAIINELALRVNEKTGLCYPSIPTLARFVHATPRTVTASIKYLKQMGIITVTHFKGRRIHNSYTLHIKECIHVPHPDRLKPSPDENNSGEKSSPETSSAEDLGKVAPVKKIPCNNRSPHRTNCRDGNSTHIPRQDRTYKSSTNPIKPHSPPAQAKGMALMGYVVEGSVEVTSPEKKTDGSECDLPMTAMMDAKIPPQGYPDEDKFDAFAKTLVLNPNYENTILQAAKYVFEQMCKQGFADVAGNYFKNWRKYARSSIAKLVDDAHRHIINWDDSLVNIRDVTPAEIGQWRSQSESEPQSKPAEQPQKPLPPPTEERKPDLKPPSPVETPSVEHPPTAKPKVKKGLVITDPAMRLSMELSRIKREREEASRHKRVIAASTGHAEGVYYRGNG